MSIFDDNIIESNPITAQSIADMIAARKDENRSDISNTIDDKINSILQYIFWYVKCHFNGGSIATPYGENNIKVYLNQFGKTSEVIKYLDYITNQFTSLGFAVVKNKQNDGCAYTTKSMDMPSIIISWEYLVEDDNFWNIINMYMNGATSDLSSDIWKYDGAGMYLDSAWDIDSATCNRSYNQSLNSIN